MTPIKRPLWKWVLLVIAALLVIALFSSPLVVLCIPFLLLFGGVVAAIRAKAIYQRSLWVSIAVLQSISLATGGIAWWLWGIAFELADIDQSTAQIDAIWQPLIIICGISFVISIILAVTSLILRSKSTAKHRI